ncbi:uncharacterized protein LOC127239725 [Andrographis paniculata]|uniref:uncharacterized protein LOC127239725 n=1 Tax=Andrographis paniculata TaxID=175694 RepID=UPI0021E6EE4A|nr:uncharacterized protein LOC127239725 [Andrographis paniculata]
MPPDSAVAKTWKGLLPPPAKPPPSAINFMRTLLAICIFLVFSLCYLSMFPTVRLRPNFSDSGHNLINVSQERRRFTAGDDQTNISHILFGIGGSSDTWGRRRHYCELWWKPNVTRGYVWLDEKPSDSGKGWPETSPPYRISEDTTRFKYTNWIGSRSAIRIARIVKESFELGLENVRWFVMGDDDTVFFTENLVNVLNRYDHNQMYYIGAVSESVDQALVHSYTMGYGGAGFAISYPLAAELVTLLDGCIDRYAAAYGSDHKIGSCMSEIGVPLTKELGFHQMDIRGSAFGLLSAHPLAPLVSMHHLDYVQPLFPGRNRVNSMKKLFQAYGRDPSRTLQQSFFYDPTRNWSVSIAWGYNVQLYPFPMTARDLRTPLQTFLTWSWNRKAFTFNTRSTSMKPCLRPIIFYLDRVEKTENGDTMTTYTRPRLDIRRRCDRDNFAAAHSVVGFNVTAPVLDPLVFHKAPRRQCAELLNGPDEAAGLVHIRLRGCKPRESVTLP